MEHRVSVPSRVHTAGILGDRPNWSLGHRPTFFIYKECPVSNSKTRFFWLLLRDFLVLKNIGRECREGAAKVAGQPLAIWGA